MLYVLKLLVVAACIAAVLADKQIPRKQNSDKISGPSTQKSTRKPQTEAKVHHLPQKQKTPKSSDGKDLNSSDTYGIGYYGVPVAYSTALYPRYYPYYPYYGRYLGYGLRYRPWMGFRAYGALPVVNYPYLG